MCLEKRKLISCPPLPVWLSHWADLQVGHVYFLSKLEMAALQDFIAKNLWKRFIKSSMPPLATLVLFMKKKSGELRLCCNYWRLNDNMIQNCHPLPLILELLEKLCQAKIFMKLDLRRAYNLVQICKEDEWKMAFWTYDYFENTIIRIHQCPWGLHALYAWCVPDLLDQFAVIYLDDILVYPIVEGALGPCAHCAAASLGTPAFHKAREMPIRISHNWLSVSSDFSWGCWHGLWGSQDSTCLATSTSSQRHSMPPGPCQLLLSLHSSICPTYFAPIQPLFKKGPCLCGVRLNRTLLTT